MAQSQTTHEQDHVERAKQIADALDSQDVEQTLYEQFYAEFKAWESEDPAAHSTRAFDRAIGRGKDYTGRIVRHITSAAPGTPFDRKDGRNKGDAAAAARALADPAQREKAAPHIARAMEDPEVREEVAKHMMPGAARDLSERANRDHPARRKLAEPLGVPEPKVSYETRMSGPLVRIHDAIDYFIETHEQYSSIASDEELESVRDEFAGEVARAQAATTDWSIR